MKITRVNIPVSAGFSDGLGAINMDRLGQVVVLAGKNGAGKSRLIKRIVDCASDTEIGVDRTVWQKRVTDLDKLLADKNLSAAAREDYSRELEKAKSVYARTTWVEYEPADKMPVFVHLVPKLADLSDCHDLNKGALKKSLELVAQLGAVNLASNAFAFIQHLQNAYWEATHQNSKFEETAKKSVVKEYEKFKVLLEQFLGTKLTRSPEGDAELFGFRLGQSALSEGQKLLVQFCVALHVQGAELSEAIIIAEEPENHLHPSAMLEVIDRLQKCAGQGQVWITTHSVPLLSHFDASAIWWMDGGQVSYAGNIPQQVLGGLLGDENRISKLSDFLNLPAVLATNRFAFQSLFPPLTVDARGDDPQLAQIQAAIKKFRANGKLRILDLGAGKGRLASAILFSEQLKPEHIRKEIDYVAFDLDPKDASICIEAIASIYGNADKRYFNDRQKLLETYDLASFDVIVMCNVLHEIDPLEWLDLFDKSGAITPLLKTTGILLIVEDTQIRIGEKAYQKGFLVLDAAQLKMLFRITEADKAFVTNRDKSGLLIASEIPSTCLQRISAASRKEAIESISSVAKNKIKKLRTDEPTYQNGRAHGFWVQQLANAQFTLDQIGKL